MAESFTSSFPSKLKSMVSPSSNVNTVSLSNSNIDNSRGIFKKGLSLLKNNSTLRIIIYIVIIVFAIIILINLIIKSYNIFIDIKQKKPWLLYGTKDAKQYQYVIQDIENNPLQLIKTSSNRPGGLEFTYGCWIYIDNYDYGKSKWKNIFHKGSSKDIDCPHASNARSSQCPGLWLDPDENTLHVFINTFISDSTTPGNNPDDSLPNIPDDLSTMTPCAAADKATALCQAATQTATQTAADKAAAAAAAAAAKAKAAAAAAAATAKTSTTDSSSCPPFTDDSNNIIESEKVENIPINNWVNIVVAVRQHNVDIYINGILAKRKLLKYLPKQNNGKFHINANGGFEGFVSNIKYFSYYISEGELFNYVSSGPSKLPPVNTIAKPPYLAERWWLR